MKKKPYVFVVFAMLCFSLVAFQCEDNDDVISSKEEDLSQLTTLKTEIENLANSSRCNEAATCKFIAFGSKPCGGPWSYLIYSTAINEEQLKSLVETYNEKEANFNKKWGIVSDCALAQQPSSIKCENNTCVAVF